MKKVLCRVCFLFSLLFLFFFSNSLMAAEKNKLKLKVMVVVYNPEIGEANNKPLTEVLKWSSPDKLLKEYISTVREVSSGFVNYKIVEKYVLNEFPVKEDGFQYSDETYMDCWKDHSTCHDPDGVDYLKILDEYFVCEKFNAGEIDEFWIFGGPWFGYYESRLTGNGAFEYNSPPLEGSSCKKLMPIMGFNYERTVSEMIENLGHRSEAVLTHVFDGWDVNQSRTDWDRFGHNRGQTQNVDFFQCGSVHYAPNSLSDYDWKNKFFVTSNCDDWYNFPNFKGVTKIFNCEEWGCTGLGYKKWWLKHIPRVKGKKGSIYNNWWRYIADYNNI